MKQKMKQEQQNVNYNSDSNTNTNEVDNTDINEVIITDNTVVEDKREFIDAPVHAAPDAKFAENVAPFTMKSFGGSIFDTMPYITYEDAQHVAKDCDDYKIQRATLPGGKWTSNGMDNLDVAIDAAVGSFRGYITLTPTGDDVDVDSCMGRIVQKAMKEGFDQYRVVGISKGEAAVGDSLNLSLGGGASVMSQGQDFGVSGTNGLGWSSAEAWKETRSEIKIEVYLTN